MKVTIPRNAVLLGLLLAWLALAAVMFTWFSMHMMTYQKEWQTYAVQVQGTLDKAGQSEHTPPTLVALADELQAIKQPTVPHLFGLSIGADTERTKQSQVTQKLAALQVNVRATAAFIDYQQKVADELRPLSLAAAGSESKIRALGQKWQQATDAVKSLTPPVILVDAHASLGHHLQEAQRIIASLADFYKNDDEAGFKTKYEQLQAAVAALRAQSADITAIATALDAERATLITHIKQNL